MAVMKVRNGDAWQTVTGGSGVNFATFTVDPTTGMLSVNWTMESSEIVFSLNNGILEVAIQ